MNQLNEYIERQKEIDYSPFLTERILSKTQKMQLVHRSPTLWQSVAVAASIAIVIMAGIKIGSSYKQADRLAINDNYIENFSILTSNENE